MKRSPVGSLYLAAVVTGLACGVTLPASAQDAHYWTNQYGTRGELLGGLVVGSFVDLSATFYNPGAIVFINQPSLVLTTDAWEYQHFTFDDIAPEALDLRAGRVRPAPSLFALQIPSKQSKHRFAVSAVTRHSFEINASARRIPPVPEMEAGSNSIGSSLEASVERRLGEAWLGLSWSYPLGRRVGVGVTTYGAGRTQTGRSQVLSQVVDSAGGGSTARLVREFSYWNVRLLWKAGVAVDLRPLTFGLTLTTPSVNIFGRGRMLINDGTSAVDLSDSSATNELEATFRSGLASRYKSAAAIAVGAAFRFRASTAYATAEWFGGVGRYTIVDGGNVVGQTTGDTLSTELIYELRSVINWGIGFEHALSNRFQAYAAFFSDQSALPDGKIYNIPVAVSDWDMWHVSAGGAFVVGNLDITLGASYGWGSDTVRKPIDVPGESPTAELEFRSIKLIFGFGAAF